MHPPDSTQQNGPGGVATPTEAEKNKTAAQSVRSDATVPRQRKPRHVTGQTDLLDLLDLPAPTVRRSRKAYASLYAPDGVRKNWALKYRCPKCGKYHGGQAASREAADGKRTARCGRVVEIDVKRVYGEVSP